MVIAIIGSGNVGGTLAKIWSRAGHRVVFGSRDPSSEKIYDLLASCPKGCSAAHYQDAVKEAEVIVLATPWENTVAAIELMGPLEGKIILDATNPVNEDLTGLAETEMRSGAETIAKHAKGARVVKIFNSTGCSNMELPQYGADTLTLLYCGDDPSATAVAERLALEVGFDPIDAGPLSNAHLLEELALLWATLAQKQGYGTDFAFNFVKRPRRAAVLV